MLKAPLGADHVPDAAFPVRVPTTVIEPPEQTICALGETVTPLKVLTLILSVFGPLLPQGLKAWTVTFWLFPTVAPAPTDTVITLVPAPDVIVKPGGKVHV